MFFNVNNKYKLHYLLSKHNGTGGYIITPKGISILLKAKIKVNVSVDHYLFNPNNSNVFKTLKPLQIVPSICEQHDTISDIHSTRLILRKKSFYYFWQEFIRGYYEIKLLPHQFFQYIFKGAKLIKPRFF